MFSLRHIYFLYNEKAMMERSKGTLAPSAACHWVLQRSSQNLPEAEHVGVTGQVWKRIFPVLGVDEKRDRDRLFHPPGNLSKVPCALILCSRPLGLPPSPHPFPALNEPLPRSPLPFPP